VESKVANPSGIEIHSEKSMELLPGIGKKEMGRHSHAAAKEREASVKPVAKMSLLELAAWVCSRLQQQGISVVLSGGSVVSLFTENRHQSNDLDFIENGSHARKQLKKVMGELGFSEENRYFTHPETDFFVEFPSGPLSVGNEPVKEIVEIKTKTGILKIISPTECVKDRLCAYYHWKDLQSLEQAKWVCEKHSIRWKEVKRWSDQEGMGKEFNKILKFLNPDCAIGIKGLDLGTRF
jgi:hypothetical protein